MGSHGGTQIQRNYCKDLRKSRWFFDFPQQPPSDSYPEAWRPESIFGEWGSNDLINQRITGELHLDDFEVSHTKDGIYWRFSEEREVGELIKKQIDDLITQAKKDLQIPKTNETWSSQSIRKCCKSD